MATGTKNSKVTLRNTIGGIIGNVLEWYDFAVFGYFAPIIAEKFFPSEDPIASLINAFGVFAAGYLVRPLGGIVFGHLGDRIGRKYALQLSVMIMVVPTTLLGLLPTYSDVGILAPILLIIIRLVQGFSVGGELIGSVSYMTEVAPPSKRGFLGSFSFMGAVGGVLLGSFVATIAHGLFDATVINDWGWRVPFLFGFLVGLFGLWMRKGLVETADFKNAKEKGEIAANPVKEVILRMP
ncbi:MAG: MFS transporter, partial [Thermodesulfobacteriota bacterium]